MGQKRSRTGRDRRRHKATGAAEIRKLNERVLQDAPIRQSGATNLVSAKAFAQLPISKLTKAGLREAGFHDMTLVQRSAIPHALAGRDILGAAKTGSGKTLAFLVPALELLYRQSWSNMDGVGILILAPIRELAVQIFNVLKDIGKHHRFSAGLVIGGKDYDIEAQCIVQMNILVGTPGRILHHLDNTPLFHLDSLKMLVLDEADRCMDENFSRTMNAILSATIGSKRQTLLFSATQTRDVDTLARLTLKEPEVVSVHDTAQTATPVRLAQTYTICPETRKLDLMFSFLKTHTTEKSLIFGTSCKEIRYLFEIFRRLRPGLSVLHLHGRMKQIRRLEIVNEFEQRGSAAMFCTDVAARGLDFKDVDWVIQFDCPEDCDTYIHRVGRTARFRNSGKSMIVLLPSEAKMVERLHAYKISLKKVAVNPDKLFSIVGKIKEFLAQDSELLYLAKKAFATYVKSVFTQKYKDVFNLQEMDLEGLSAAMGLPGTPVLKLMNDAHAKKRKNMSASLRELLEKKESNEDASDTRMQRMVRRKNNTIFDESREKFRLESSDSEDSDDILVPKDTETGISGVTTKRNDWEKYLDKERDVEKDRLQSYSTELKEYVDEADPVDREVERQRVKNLHKLQKLAMKQQNREYYLSDDEEDVDEEIEEDEQLDVDLFSDSD